MSQPNRPLIGSVLERKPSAAAPAPKPPGSFSATGFPAVQHRSKSAFARGREGIKKLEPGLARPVAPPLVKPSEVMQHGGDGFVRGGPAPETEQWRRQMAEENERRVAAMTEEEREEERRDIEERFGKDIGEILRRTKEAREARERQMDKDRQGKEEDEMEIERAETPTPLRVSTKSLSPSPPPILSAASTRPSSRTGRLLRFADLRPEDVHVYESAPPSPRRKTLALPPPSMDATAVSLGQWKGKLPAFAQKEPVTMQEDVQMASPTALKPSGGPAAPEPEEGTPEYIRRRFFPNAPADDPNLAWIQALPPAALSGVSAPRFDLQGAPVPSAIGETMPTHLGLHHHADGGRAGYTLDDIFLLSRSTVPAQRATMLSVLAKIGRRLGTMARGDQDARKGLEELAGKELELRKRILAAGVEAMGEKGSVGAMAVEIMWVCVVDWDEEVAEMEGVELQEEQPESLPSDEEKAHAPVDAISSLPLEYLLPQITAAFGFASLPHESLLELLAVTLRLARHTNAFATAITTTPSMIANVMRTFVLTPIPPRQSEPPPAPLAIQLLTTLALSSRANAHTLVDPADALLRFITILPPSSPYPLPLATSLLVHTLRFYTVLASFGLYAHIATTAAEPLRRLGAYVVSPACEFHPIIAGYPGLLGAWIVCATDPHQTTPEHDILWSQVDAWGWGADLLRMRTRLGQTSRDTEAWAAVWDALAAWLEGAHVNAVRGGESEREHVRKAVAGGFASGTEKQVVLVAMGELRLALGPLGDVGTLDVERLQRVAAYSNVLSSAMRLWLACLPSTADVRPEPPFLLPLSLLSALSADIATHNIFSLIYSGGVPSYAHVLCRPLTRLLATYVCVARRIPNTPDDLWLAQLSSVLIRLIPGDEESAHFLITQAVDLVNERFLSTRGWTAPEVIWERGGMHVVGPFLTFSLRPTEESSIGPLVATTRSIKFATTQRLPPAWVVRRRAHGSSLPLARDWPLTALDHLLRSGTSPVWHNLPDKWDASETEVVRASLLLAKVVREALRVNGLAGFAIGRADAVVGCMKVFMLEHGQVQGAPVQGTGAGVGSDEVFRDAVVSALMEDLVVSYTLEASPDGLSAAPAAPGHDAEDDIEAVGARFLGASTPFFQFYTDFVALYDAISFGHPLFAALLLPPTAQRYAKDYRKLLYAETAHTLATVRTPIGRVIGGRIGEFLWPAESDSEIIGAYLGIVLGLRGRGHVEGFVRWIVVHHVAANIWPDLREIESLENAAAEERARKLLEAVMGQGRNEDVREVVLYWQRRDGAAVLSPACFALDAQTRAVRLAWVRGWAAQGISDRISSLFDSLG